MTSLLSIAAEFFDRLSSPRFGQEAQDDAGERLAALFRDEDAQGRFQREISALSDPAELSPDGWFWVLRFARSNAIELNPELLQGLCLRWSSAPLIALAVDVALGRAAEEADQQTNDVTSIEQIPDDWLRALVEELRPLSPYADNSDRDDESVADSASRIRHAEAVFTALLIVERPSTITAARAMLQDQEALSIDLPSLVQSRLDLLDEDAQASWRETLRWG